MKVHIILTTALILLMMCLLSGCKGNGASVPVSDAELVSEDEEQVLNEEENNESPSNPQLEKEDDDKKKSFDLSAIIFPQIDEANNKWLQSFNEYQGDVAELYHDQSLLFKGKEEPIRGKEEISDYYKNIYEDVPEITEINVDARFLKSASLVYEIGQFITVDKEEYQYLVIWDNKSDSWVRTLELVEKKLPNQVNTEEIDESRANWVKLCNAHNARALVEALYTANAFYHHSGGLFRGHDEISPQYFSMNNSNYNLDLEPKNVKVVQSELVYEIGKCSGDYLGYYILRWEKDSDGIWKVSLDSNY